MDIMIREPLLDDNGRAVLDANNKPVYRDVNEPVEVPDSFNAFSAPLDTQRRLTRKQIEVLLNAVERNGGVEPLLDEFNFSAGIPMTTVINSVMKAANAAARETMKGEEASTSQDGLFDSLFSALDTDKVQKTAPRTWARIQLAMSPTADRLALHDAIDAMETYNRRNTTPSKVGPEQKRLVDDITDEEADQPF